MILPKDRDPRFITIRRDGRVLTPTIGSWLSGLPRARSTFCTFFESVQPSATAGGKTDGRSTA
jgi:hypothetical protein